MRYVLAATMIGLVSHVAAPSLPVSRGARLLSPSWQGIARLFSLCQGESGELDEREGSQTAETRPAVRFTAIDIFIDTADQPLAAWQFELLADQGREREQGASRNAVSSQPAPPGAKIVGVEGGEHPAFREPPYYDPAALSHHRIIIAAFSTGRDLPTGKTRVARLHLQITGPEPQYKMRLDVAVSAEGKDIPAKITIEPGATR